ncbi:MAG: hypothetical protein K2K12_00385, partial [Clostridia bacterium]|nr:hypothetical protein [Clostridia bacterium]
MVYAFITGFLFVALIAAGVVIFLLHFIRSKKGRGVKKWQLGLAAGMAGVGFVLMIFIPGSFHTVDAGTVAVVKQLGVITDIESPGTYFDFWLIRNYQIYDAKVQQVEIKMDAYTADAQSMDISMVVQFQIRQENLTEIAINYGGLDKLTNRIQSVAIERTKATLSQYQAEKLIEDRNKISPTVEEEISKAIGDKYYVTFNSAVLT